MNLCAKWLIFFLAVAGATAKADVVAAPPQADIVREAVVPRGMSSDNIFQFFDEHTLYLGLAQTTGRLVLQNFLGYEAIETPTASSAGRVVYTFFIPKGVMALGLGTWVGWEQFLNTSEELKEPTVLMIPGLRVVAAVHAGRKMRAGLALEVGLERWSDLGLHDDARIRDGEENYPYADRVSFTSRVTDMSLFWDWRRTIEWGFRIELRKRFERSVDIKGEGKYDIEMLAKRSDTGVSAGVYWSRF